MGEKSRYKYPRMAYNVEDILSILRRYLNEKGDFFQGTIDDLAELMKVERKTIYNWRKKGYLHLNEARIKLNGIKGFSISKIEDELIYFECGY